MKKIGIVYGIGGILYVVTHGKNIYNTSKKFEDTLKEIECPKNTKNYARLAFYGGAVFAPMVWPVLLIGEFAINKAK